MYAFVWGWINAGCFNLKNVMIAWTVCILFSIIGGVLQGGSAAMQGFDSNYLAPFASVVAAALGF